jgi:hypothetical protein
MSTLALLLALNAAPLKLASVGFTGVGGVSDEQAEYFADRFVTQLAKDPNVQLLTRKDFTADQLQLLTCCLSQLADSLHADGLITGEVARVDGAFVVSVKIVAADGTRALFSMRSRPLSTERAVLSELDRAANRALNSMGDPVPEELLHAPEPAPVPRSIFKLSPAAVGAVGLIASAIFFTQAQTDYSQLTGTMTLANPELVRDQGKTSLTLGVALSITSAVLIVVGILWYVLS